MGLFEALRGHARRRRAQSASRSSGEAIERGVTSIGLAVGLAAGAAVAFFSFANSDWRAATTAACTFLASISVGAFGGFIFSLPRDSQTPSKSNLKFLFNSNLLKVSDFITTLIVGLSLVTLTKIPGAIGDLGGRLKVPLGNHSSSAAFGVGLLVFGFSSAFILMYLWTTVRLRQHLERSEIELVQDITDTQARAAINRFVSAGIGNEVEISDVIDSMSVFVMQRELAFRLQQLEDSPPSESRSERIATVIRLLQTSIGNWADQYRVQPDESTPSSAGQQAPTDVGD